MTKNHKRISIFLSYVLRHAPESIGLTLDEKGWAKIDELIECAAGHGRTFDLSQLREVVATNDKERFSLSEDGRRIRANQWHSIQVNLGLEVVAPPEKLYHGTATRFLAQIYKGGLQPGNRHHVHLSLDRETAVNALV